jgi:hypothetical protein
VIAEIADTYGYLLGRWRVQRTFVDHRLERSGSFSGVVDMAPIGSDDQFTATYCEFGELRIGAYRGDARRKLICVRRPDGVVAIKFDDRRAFLECDLRSGRGRAVHLCGDDRYQITWRVHASDAFVEEWRVRGPSKDYQATSVLRRAGHSGQPTRGAEGVTRPWWSPGQPEPASCRRA